jgi:hypothetical protein
MGDWDASCPFGFSKAHGNLCDPKEKGVLGSLEVLHLIFIPMEISCYPR